MALTLVIGNQKCTWSRCRSWIARGAGGLAFAEVIGFTWSYLLAAGAITGLLTAYSAAVLKSWIRARIIAGLLVGLYATLFVLLNLEAYSLLIGSVLLFVALASVMWATRHIDWTQVGSANGEAPAPRSTV